MKPVVMILSVVFALFCLLIPGLSESVVDSKSVELDGIDVNEKNAYYERIIAIGDIHGSFEGLLDILYSSNITTEHWKCDMKPQRKRLLLIQMGDLVDRGGGALESWECLQKLQSTALENNAKVVRLFGNHELWWLGGLFHMINKVNDSPAVLKKMVQYMKDDILKGDVTGSFYYNHRNVLPLLFTHAGISPEYLYAIANGVIAKAELEFNNLYPNQIQNEVEHLNTKKQEVFNRVLAAHIQDVLVNSVKNEKCAAKGSTCEFTEVEYAAGRERGGGPIGGPYWNDFSVLERNTKAGYYDKALPGVVQIVGHSAANCYSIDNWNFGTHPMREDNACSQGLIRTTTSPSGNSAAICVDGGMYMGARSFLMIDDVGVMSSNGEAQIQTTVTSVERRYGEPHYGQWVPEILLRVVYA